MERVKCVIEGEKLGIEKFKNGDKERTILHVLNGMESVKMSVLDNNLVNTLNAVPNRKPVKLACEVQDYKGQLYVTALSIIN